MKYANVDGCIRIITVKSIYKYYVASKVICQKKYQKSFPFDDYGYKEAENYLKRLKQLP